MGGLRHNTIVLNWPNKWNKEFFTKPNQPDEDDDNSLSLSSFVRKSIQIIIMIIIDINKKLVNYVKQKELKKTS